jgi:hypothetical protein
MKLALQVAMQITRFLVFACAALAILGLLQCLVSFGPHDTWELLRAWL